MCLFFDQLLHDLPSGDDAHQDIAVIDDRNEVVIGYLGDKFFPTHEETVDEINRLLDRTEVFEITIEHMSGKVVKEK